MSTVDLGHMYSVYTFMHRHTEVNIFPFPSPWANLTRIAATVDYSV